MSSESIIALGRETLYAAMVLAAPVLLVGLVVGVLIAIFQAVTSVQEQTLSQIPKMLAVAITLILLMPWMIERITTFTREVFERMSGGGA